MGYKEETKKLIAALLFDNSNQLNDITRLVHITSSIAKSYLKNYYPAFLRICTKKGMTEGDLAEDSVLQIFARDSHNRFHVLRSFANSLDSSYSETSAEEIFKVYQAFIHTISIRQLIKTYAEIDPAGAKIYRNIRDYIRKTESISVFRDYRGLVLKPSNRTSQEHRPAIPFRELEQRFIANVKKPYTTPNLLLVLFSVLENQEKYRHSLPFFDAVKLFKRHYSHVTNNADATDDGFKWAELSKLDHTIIKQEVYEIIRKKIFTTYVISGKINYDEAHSLYQTVVAIINSWFKKEDSDQTIYDYAHLNFDINKDTYKRDWRTKIEYLIRIARDQIKMYMLEGL